MQSFVFIENMVYQFVVLVCSSIQNTSHLSIVLGLTFRISKPIKFSSPAQKRSAFEVRKKNVNLVFTYLAVFSRAVRIFSLFSDANLSTVITVFYYHRRLCISLANNWDLFLKTVSIVSLSFHLVIKGSYSYRLRTTTLKR